MIPEIGHFYYSGGKNMEKDQKVYLRSLDHQLESLINIKTRYSSTDGNIIQIVENNRKENNKNTKYIISITNKQYFEISNINNSSKHNHACGPERKSGAILQIDHRLLQNKKRRNSNDECLEHTINNS